MKTKTSDEQNEKVVELGKKAFELQDEKNNADVEHTNLMNRIQYRVTEIDQCKRTVFKLETQLADEVKQKDEMKKEFDEMDERCNPQCMLNQEPGYVIYSAVGSFYAPMLVMMFFNWRIYQTAKKTTKAIRQGWTRVKGTKTSNTCLRLG